MRLWSNRLEDGGAVHALGNGAICAYGCGPDIMQVFGPPYSTPNFFSLRIDEAGETACTSARRAGAAIWDHALTRGGEALGMMTDAADAHLPVFLRRCRLSRPLALRLAAESGIACLDNGTRYANCALAALAEMHPGRFVFAMLPTTRHAYMQVLVRGNATVTRDDGGAYRIVLAPGESSIAFIGGERYPQVVENTERYLARGDDALIDEAAASWARFTARRTDLSAEMPGNAPHRAAVLEAADDVAVLLKAQQCASGGVVAGHQYHLFYVRDQYGVSRGLLRLGLLDEARAILSLCNETFARWGRIHNAQGTPEQGLFHIHEDDGVEITGYLLVQAFDFLDASGDEAFIRSLMPMLAWAFQAQASRLAGGMLPFNGDETYVAGGILPRSALCDGSAEATLLFITGGDKLLAFAERHRLWPARQLAEARACVASARNAYHANFVRGGRLYANNPQRTRLATPNRFRHGVCEGCTRVAVWIERSDAGRYLCPECFVSAAAPAMQGEMRCIQPVSLMPAYIGAPLPEPALLADAARDMARQYLETGRLPSRPDGELSVGYDYGLLLYSLCAFNAPEAEALFARTMAARDDAGAWSEYYLAHQPIGTRCRPWESGINLCAVLAYAAGSKKF